MSVRVYGQYINNKFFQIILRSNLNFPSTSNVYVYVLQHTAVQFFDSESSTMLVHASDCLKD